MKIKTQITLILTILSLVLLTATQALCWNLTWNASEGALGYRVHYNELVTPEDITVADVGNNILFSLDDIALVEGTRYEFKCVSYNEAGSSSFSNTLRWTVPRESIVIEMLGAPINITINP